MGIRPILARQAWDRNINTFETTAAGRLFDAAACLLLGRELASYEGQGPMELEQVATRSVQAPAMPLVRDEQGIWRSDWSPLIPGLLDQGLDVAHRAGNFHRSMAQAIVDQAERVRKDSPFMTVGLSGGVFQNRLLTEMAVEMLAEKGFDVRLHQDIPANDGGLAFGQIIEAMYAMGNNGDDTQQEMQS